MMKVLVLIGFLVLAVNTQAQEKIEREWRIPKKEVPLNATSWFKDAYELPKKVKWYAEENETGNYFEAKLCWKKQKHSVKFFESGEIQDIEMEFKLADLPEELRTSIQQRLDSISSNYRIIKLQQQWTGSSENLEDLIDENEKKDLTIKYELELFIRSGEEAGYHELLFSNAGDLLLKRPIRINTADHLQF